MFETVLKTGKVRNWIVYKKLHRWPGLILSFILLYYGITGIFMNHRELFSEWDVDRALLPDNYHYRNWNNAAIKGSLVINSDSIVVFGNIGIWLTDSAFTSYRSLNAGFPPGSDNRKISDVHRTSDGNLYAASLFGLYAWDYNGKSWLPVPAGKRNGRYTAIESIGDTLYITDRSLLWTGISDGIRSDLKPLRLPPPPDYDGKITLFETIWQIHSGEIFGIPGQLFVDMLGLVTVFLSVTGIIYFFFPGWIKRRIRRNKSSEKIISISRWSLRWHNKAGAWTFILLIILYFTGMFLRPPLLIAIGTAKVAPLRFSHLDQPNPWYDKLRDIIYDPERNIFLLSTYDAVYYMEPRFIKPVPFEVQPPVSVMGINAFEKYDSVSYLVGSFSGLFLWNPASPEIINYVTGQLYEDPGSGKPVGDYKVSGVITDGEGRRYMADYAGGLIPLRHERVLPAMPAEILEESGMSLWNLCLEFHTGRIFEKLTGGFYILIVPLVGIAGITVVISGYILWRRKYRKTGYGELNY